MDQSRITKKRVIARLWELASLAPEKTNATLGGQVDACKMLHDLGYKPAIHRLSEIAETAKSRTGERETDQKAADTLLTKIVGSMELENTTIQ